MTTIAYDGKTIAFDSRQTMGSTIMTDDVMKILDCQAVDGALILAGSTYDADQMADC